ncbi:AMIN-like domain-containing (lipo)protein [Planosporangium mesophilum]|uniref:AMIN-like domain-containing protein n=1 Tax=Planosporangium mesophilum TaxID=689768 RepID=A0A8J3TGB8_9ACTN|nr:hypothetical protein [Planosporangium mesophilum]GII24627.1 hypothetical protein Pme01_42240 [Planosporangium mesophilum]
MKLRNVLVAMAVTACGLVAAAAPAGAGMMRASTAAPYCGITWGSQDRSADALSTAVLLYSRTGQHDCYDRVVFEFDGPANGYAISYGEAYTEGQGLALSPYTAGGAVLKVTLLAPAYYQSGAEAYPYRSGDHTANVVGYQTLRDVVFGGSFEGYTSFAVGVRARLPYRVFVLSGPGTHSRIVLDVAHRW